MSEPPSGDGSDVGAAYFGPFEGEGTYVGPFAGAYVSIGMVPPPDRFDRPAEQTYHVDAADLAERELVPVRPDPVPFPDAVPGGATHPLWRLVDLSLYAEHGLVDLVDDELEVGAPAGLPDDETWLLAAPGWVLVSTARDVIPELAFEAWDGRPADDDERWERELVTVVEFPSHSFRAEATTSGVSAAPLMVLPWCEDGRYYIRVQSRGAAAAARAFDDRLEQEDAPIVTGVDQWRFQFWAVEPAGAD